MTSKRRTLPEAQVFRQPGRAPRWARRAGGLTLVEMLVALFIMAVLAVLAFRSVAGMIDVETHLADSGRRFDRLAAVVNLLEQDLAFATDAGEPFFRGEGGEAGRFGEIRFSRGGSGYGGTAQSGPRRIGYRFVAGRLEKLLHPPPWAGAAAPEIRPLLAADELQGLYFRFLDRAGGWHARWPVRTVTGLPRAVEARFLLAGAGGEIRRVYLLP